ncbi:Hypothetical_protein [Hexamita inflata]|uniref:Hypothetical_protein n=1 Tax=Hexamita inflata TaxID=28002 RepID=A0AA86QNL1_9EUKA|nr:Hypothetical protein HINF_LOCUS49168 [Hexamita inflata]
MNGCNMMFQTILACVSFGVSIWSLDTYNKIQTKQLLELDTYIAYNVNPVIYVKNYTLDAYRCIKQTKYSYSMYFCPTIQALSNTTEQLFDSYQDITISGSDFQDQIMYLTDQQKLSFPQFDAKCYDLSKYQCASQTIQGYIAILNQNTSVPLRGYDVQITYKRLQTSVNTQTLYLLTILCMILPIMTISFTFNKLQSMLNPFIQVEDKGSKKKLNFEFKYQGDDQPYQTSNQFNLKLE